MSRSVSPYFGVSIQGITRTKGVYDEDATESACVACFYACVACENQDRVDRSMLNANYHRNI